MVKKGVLAILILAGFIVAFYFWSTLRCKSMAKGAAYRIGYSFRDGCYIDLAGEKVPLR